MLWRGCAAKIAAVLSEGTGMVLRSACALPAGLLLFAFSALPAAAIEAATVADALGAALTKGSHAAASYDSAAFDGDNVVIQGLTFSSTSTAQSVRFEETVVESPADGATGIFHSPRVTLSDGVATGNESGSVASVTATDVTVLDPAVAGDGFLETIRYRTADVSGVEVLRNKVPRDVTVDSMRVEFGDAADDGMRTVSAAMQGLSVSSDIFTHRRFAILARARLRLEELGTDALVFDATLNGAWNEETGTLAIADSSLDFRDNARFSASGTVSELPDPRALNDADAVARVSTLKIHDLVTRYEEKAFAGRVFDLLAKEQELSRDEYVEQLSQALPFLLANLTDAAFRKPLIDALRTFVTTPRSLTVSIAPEPPMSGSEIISMVRSDLGELPNRLKATIKANAEE